MPLRNLIQRIRDRNAQENEIFADNPGSTSLADGRSFSRGAQLGNLFGVTNTGSHTKTQTVNNNAGSQNLAVNNALTNSVNVAGLPITNTFSGSRSNENGDRSRQVQHQLNVGGLGLTTGLNSENRGSGFGVNRQPGNAGFHLGPLSLQLMNNGGLLGGNRATGAGGASQVQTNADLLASGDGASTNAQTHSGAGGRSLGLLNLQNSFSNSQGIAQSQNGDTTANAGASGFQQNSAGIPQTQEYDYSQPGVGLFGPRRYQRSPQFFQNGRGPIRRLLYGPGPPNYQGSEYGPNPGPQFGHRPGFRPGGFQNWNQNAGANTHSNNQNNPFGNFGNTGGSSQASNLAQDGSGGQLAGANTAQENFNTAQGLSLMHTKLLNL